MKYEPKSYWNERFEKYGHTGEGDEVIYAYDQPQRLRAIEKAIARCKIKIDQESKVLDIGCGSGDIISLFTKYDKPHITCIDLSDKAIDYAKKRFSADGKIRFFTSGIEDINFASSSFDLITAVNVLQHIIDEHKFSKAIGNMVRTVKPNGHILTMDFSPFVADKKISSSYMIARSIGEYINSFEGAGCKLILKFGLPRIGVRLCRSHIFKRLIKRSRTHHRQLIKKRLFKLSKPFDCLLVPFPARFSDMNILIFKKIS